MKPSQNIMAELVDDPKKVVAELVDDAGPSAVANGQPATDGPSATVIAEIVEEPAPSARLPEEPAVARPWLMVRIWRGIASAVEWCFGVAALIAGLAILSAIPILFFLSLGYLLEVCGRIARTGKFTSGFVGVRKAARVGSMAFGAAVVLLPLQLVGSVAASARIIDPASASARNWSLAHLILSMVLGMHVVIACARGGKLRHFFWPLPTPLWVLRKIDRFIRKRAWGIEPLETEATRGPFSVLLDWLQHPARNLAAGYVQARDGVWEFVTSLRLPYYFWLGARGFAGGLLWLAIPITLLAAGHQAPLLGILGGLMLMGVVMVLPFAQVRFAADDRFRAMFRLREVWHGFRRAPIAFWFALTCTLLFALPLYLLKIEYVPSEVAWLPSVVFVVFLFPARLMTGWACARAARREEPRHLLSMLGSLFLALPVAGFYALWVFFTQYTAWYGKLSLYEQHAFLVPVPFWNF